MHSNVVATVAKVPRNTSKQTSSARPPAVEIRDYNHAFHVEEAGTLRVVEALRKINLTVRAGEFVSFIGPSGCGKTTLLNVLAGLEASQSTGVKVAGAAPQAGRSDIAYMFARPALFPWRRVIDNVILGMEVRGIAANERKARARKLIEEVGLKGFESAFPGQLSQGMRQRVALARTFALKSSILLMDEPFGALDAQTKLTLEEQLVELFEESNKTIVFVTHDLGEAIALSDRVIVFSGRPGTIIRDYTVPLSRPRTVSALQGQKVYHDIYADLWQALAEAQRSARETI
jgi:NitT/TauT family transport system ATP-binding protein